MHWPARHQDWPDPEPVAVGTADSLPAAVIALHEAVLAATSELSPTEASAKQSATRLARALDELSAELSAAGHDYRPEWDSVDGIIIVRVADESGPAPGRGVRRAHRGGPP